MSDNGRSIAYFTMEIAIESGMPTYSGGLGVLAGDTIKAAADLEVPLVAITLLYRKGYFFQRLDPTGWQTEESVAWSSDDYLRPLEKRVSVNIEGREVHLAVWERTVTGAGGYTVPVYFLDSDLPENSPWDRTLTDSLYGQDSHYRLCQEVILGMGGVRMLQELGLHGIRRFHMNEGHAALLTIELLLESARADGRTSLNRADVDAVRDRCVFTTHTPVPAGHDQFPLEMVARVLPDLHSNMVESDVADVVRKILNAKDQTQEPQDLLRGTGVLNMTLLALNLSRYINGVAKMHGEVSRLMFAGYSIDSITNGVHVATWASAPFATLFDRAIPGWRRDNFSLRYAFSIPEQEVWDAHIQAKSKLMYHANRESNAGLDRDVFTIGFARRATSYKRPDLIFTDIERLRRLAKEVGPLQILYAGKAHPNDQAGKLLIQRIFRALEALKPDVKVAYLENYDLDIARNLISGVDIWLNTPMPPNEASGTSGMKAAVNGVPSLSILDGWWMEGHIEGITGWSIGSTTPGAGDPHRNEEDAASLYDKLEHQIIPMYYGQRNKFIHVMRNAIALNGSFFNTHRMMLQYVKNAYYP